MTLEPEFVLIKWRDGSTDVWREIQVRDVKTENPDNGEPVEYMTVTLPSSRRTEHTPPTLLLCSKCRYNSTSRATTCHGGTRGRGARMTTTQHSWMQTFTGRAFDPLHPDPSKVEIADIAHALSMSCRYGGHVKKFYSVAEHSIHISHLVPPQHALWGLLHDASEAYIADIVRPAKKRMPEYQEIERNLMWAICKRFNLPQLQPDEVSAVDLNIVVDEKTELMGPEPAVWTAIEGLSLLGVKIEAWQPFEAEARFIARFAKLYS